MNKSPRFQITDGTVDVRIMPYFSGVGRNAKEPDKPNFKVSQAANAVDMRICWQPPCTVWFVNSRCDFQALCCACLCGSKTTHQKRPLQAARSLAGLGQRASLLTAKIETQRSRGQGVFSHTEMIPRPPSTA